jgi:SAM-dependent methyltransferase
MAEFTCNLCGARNRADRFPTELPSCDCGSNVRIRALIHLLSLELFGRSLPLIEFPRLKAIRGLGMTDSAIYETRLADKFDYTNTYYDREPRLDFIEAHPQLYGTCDFILSADVLEHVAPPVNRALDEISKLLKPNGFLVATVPCPVTEVKEHFPDLHQYRLVPLGETIVLINRRRDGHLEITDELAFHDGPGSTLEMRLLSTVDLRNGLLDGGFREVEFLNGDLVQIGVVLDADVSQPLVARKAPFTMNRAALTQFVDSWTRQTQERDLLAKRISLASRSRWVRLGRLMGVGPRFS